MHHSPLLFQLPMNILVTGGAGYIGSVVTRQLLKQKHSVVVYDNLSRGHKETVPPPVPLIQADIADRKTLENTLRDHRIEAVMHFAAFIEAGESMIHPEQYFRNNTANALTLLEAMIAQNVSRFVFSSTAAVYGNPKDIPIKEDSLLAPTNAYGASKLLVEQMLQWFHTIHGLRYAALRYFNACGATETLGEDHQPESHLIPRAIAAVTGRQSTLQLYGTDYSTADGTCIRDYIHVSDLAAAHILALDTLATIDKMHPPLIYNLGSEKGFTNKEVIKAVGHIAGKPVPYETAPRRAGDPAILVASSQKIQQDLGWRPKFTDLDSIIKTAWDWKQKHPHGYTPTE